MPCYSPETLAHFHNPHHPGRLTDADVIGRSGSEGNGPYLTIYLRLRGEVIETATFCSFGCPAAIAVGSAVTTSVEGLTAAQATGITQANIVAELGLLPVNKRYCLRLGIDALRDALCQLSNSDLEISR
jgi:nitrogen fixation NifU-like protein